MQQANSHRRRPGLFVSMFMILTLAACASSPLINEKLDPKTGVTVTFSTMPLVFYRDTPSQAAYARNFLQLGPIQVNRSGSYRYYLWLGVWNTMQVTDLSEHREGLESVVILADGEPLMLELTGWTPASIGTSEPIYLKPVASATDAYYEVTADQIRLIADAKEIRVRSTGAFPREFQPWDDQASVNNSLAEFLKRTFF